MVSAIRSGRSVRSVAHEFRAGLSTVQRWVTRAAGQRLDRVEWADRPRGPHQPANRVSTSIEDLILVTRQRLKDTSPLGEFGDAAIHRELLAGGYRSLPSVRTIGRVLLRRGALDGRRRIRRPAPPRGWYLPAVANCQAELDSFDIVSDLVIRGGIDVEVLNAISLHGGLVESWPRSLITAREIFQALQTHWQNVGLPAYAQFDNDTRFQGAHQFADSIGRVIRLCLSLQVIPVFAPPREPGFQAAIESYNGRWQVKVWARFQHDSLLALQIRSAKFVEACRTRTALRIEAAPPRAPFPKAWQSNLSLHPHGKIIFLRRTNQNGSLNLLGHSFSIDPLWAHRLVRSEVDLDANLIRFYALRRREPTHQPLLAQCPYRFPAKPFQG